MSPDPPTLKSSSSLHRKSLQEKSKKIQKGRVGGSGNLGFSLAKLAGNVAICNLRFENAVICDCVVFLRETLCASGRWIDALKKRGTEGGGWLLKKGGGGVLKKPVEVVKEFGPLLSTLSVSP